MTEDRDRLADLEPRVNDCKRMARACLIIVERQLEDVDSVKMTDFTAEQTVSQLQDSLDALEQCIRQMVIFTDDLHRMFYAKAVA